MDNFADVVLKRWNDTALVKQAKGVSTLLNLELEISRARLHTPFEDEDLLTAIDNVGKARSVKNSQAYCHNLLQWFNRGHFKNYLPDYFNIENYNPANFNKGKKPQPKMDLQPYRGECVKVGDIISLEKRQEMARRAGIKK